MGGSSTKIAFEVCVVTGDYTGDELGPGVNMVMFDGYGAQSPTITLDNIFQNETDFTQAKFTIDLQPWSRLKVFRRLHHIEFWCTSNIQPPPAWFLDRVIIRDRRFGMTAEWKYFFFPVHQWISPDHQYVVHDCECWLPQDEPFPELRDAEIATRIQFFTFFQRAKGLPVELRDIPPTEMFTSDSRWDIESLVLEVIEHVGLAPEYMSEAPWDSLDSLGSLYKNYNITEPVGLQFWMMNDICFGAQRIRGCNPFVISLCRELPECFAAIATWIKPHLEGWTLRQLVSANRLYLLDYDLMRGLSCKRDRFMCSPLVLLLRTEKRQLKPIAIRLDQDNNGSNPIFLPTDPTQVWLQAKLWVNLADACHHMVVGRLLTHLILESIYVSLRRNLAQSHPIYQLLAPHFRSILPITRKLKQWTFENGWIARNIQLTHKGIKQLLRRAFKRWRFDVQGNIYRELESRGVYNPEGLGNYPYRQDALLIHRIFEKYVWDYLLYVYPNGTNDLLQDAELQSWRHELSSPMEEGGLGLQGVPGSVTKTGNPRPNSERRAICLSHRRAGDMWIDDARKLLYTHHLVIGPPRTSVPLQAWANRQWDPTLPSLFGSEMKRPPSRQEYTSDDTITSDEVVGLVTLDEAAKFLVGILYLSVIVAGSALRLPMFDEYGFPAHYPLSLFGPPPADPGVTESSVASGRAQSVSTLSASHVLDQVVASLPTRQMTVETVLYTRLASRVQQSALGKYESDFIFKEPAVKILEEFRKDLAAAAQQIDANNLARDMHHQYRAMDPLLMPNYPGI